MTFKEQKIPHVKTIKSFNKFQDLGRRMQDTAAYVMSGQRTDRSVEIEYYSTMSAVIKVRFGIQM